MELFYKIKKSIGLWLFLYFQFLPVGNIYGQKVYISEVFYDTPLHENSWSGEVNHHNGEFIELYNPSDQLVNIGNWKILDGDSYNVIQLPVGAIIQPKSFFIIMYAGSAFNISDLFPDVANHRNVIYQNVLRLTNNGDHVYLYDNDGTIIDQMQFGNLPTGNRLHARNGESNNISNAKNCLSLHRSTVIRDSNGNGTFTRGQWDYLNVSPLVSQFIADGNNPDGGDGDLTPIPGDKTQNYISTRSYLSADGSKFIDKIEYFDGLGRPFLDVSKGVTPQKQNIVQLQTYDGIGRDNKKWLPIPTGNDLISINDSSEIQNYYSDIRPYTEILYEPSPLNRPIGEVQVGETDWIKHSTKVEYLTNNKVNKVLQCRNFYIDSNNKLNDTRGFFEAGELFVTKSIDVDGNELYVFKNKLDQQILIRQIVDGDNVDTYFVYDDFGNLRFVVPPLMEGTVNNLDAYGYQYFYDNRNRCIRKVLPGGVENRYIYDKADRLRMSQDGNQRSRNEWSFLKYDPFGREVIRGIFVTSLSVTELEGKLNSSSLTEAQDLNTESWYSDTSFPDKSVDRNTLTIQSVNYYDNYKYVDQLPIIHQNGANLNNDYCDEEWSNAKGLLTCKKVFVETDNNFYYIKYRYDYKGKPVQIVKTFENGGFVKEYFKYSFTGNVLQKRSENDLYGYSVPDLIETYNYSYDHADRLIETNYSFKTPAMTDARSFTMSANVYNELGQLSEKKLHKETVDFVDNIRYKYNIKGLLSQISNRCEDQIIGYNKNNSNIFSKNISSITYADKNQDGISSNENKYIYKYDDLDRLLAANCESTAPINSYNEYLSYDKQGNVLTKTNESSNGNQELNYYYSGNRLKKVDNLEPHNSRYVSQMFLDGVDLEEEYKYDKVGNLIVDLNKGISKISYNRLNLPDIVQMSNGHQIRYKYDAAGGKLQECNIFARGNIDCPIGEIKDLAIHEITAQRFTEYRSNVIYKNPETYYPSSDGGYVDLLHRIQTDAGHIEKDNYTNSYSVVYHLTDHLGNIRHELEAGRGVKRSTSYYPYGMEWGSSSEIEYAFNGKEKMEAHGFNMYDYGARFYDQTLGRWHSMDPLAEKYYSISPYAYCAGNPVNAIDINGDSITTIVNLAIANSDGTTSIQSTKYHYGQYASGEYGFMDNKGNSYSGSDSFVNKLTVALNDLRSGGAVGLDLVSNLSNSANNVIMTLGRDNAADLNGAYILWNPNSIDGGINQIGKQTRPAFIGLGHEMAHIRDIWDGTIDRTAWITVGMQSIPNSEKYATHIENQLRAENKLSLRTHYGIDASSGHRVGLESTRIINGNQSIFYKQHNGMTSKGIPLLLTPFIYRRTK